MKYVERNLWPTLQSVDLADLNRQALTWCTSVANRRVHGTSFDRPADRLVLERQTLSAMPALDRLTPFVRDVRCVARDGFVQIHGSYYGVRWGYALQHVSVGVTDTLIEIWDGEERIAVHPRAFERGKRFTTPGQWAQLRSTTPKPMKRPMSCGSDLLELARRTWQSPSEVVQSSTDKGPTSCERTSCSTISAALGPNTASTLDCAFVSLQKC